MSRSRALPVLTHSHALPVAAASPVAGRPPAHAPVGLDAEGWVRRFAAAPPRLDEMVELYRALGHEVRLEPLGRDDRGGTIEPTDDTAPPVGCAGCDAALAAFRTIYTRRQR